MNGQPAWKVCYVGFDTDKRLEGMTVNGKRVIEKALGYVITFAQTLEEARKKAEPLIYARQRKHGYVRLGWMPCNTELWHGERLDAESAKKAYAQYLEKQIVE